MIRVQCRELSLSTGDCSSWFLQDLAFGADPHITLVTLTEEASSRLASQPKIVTYRHLASGLGGLFC